jgi:hypothetical protein
MKMNRSRNSNEKVKQWTIGQTMLDKAPRIKKTKKTQQLLLLYYVRWMLADEHELPSKQNFVLFLRSWLYHVTQQPTD